MGLSLRGWNTRLVVATLALACMSEWVAAAPPPPTNLIPPAEQPRQEESPAAPVETKPDAADKAKAGPRVSVHVWMIEFKTSSRDAVDEFTTRFQSALAKATEKSADFLASDELAAVVKEFRRKGQVVISDESPREIPSGQTDKWGGAVSIQATPTVQPEGKLAMSISVEFREGLDMQSGKATTTIDPGQTLILGGMVTRKTKTEVLEVPYLAQDPRFGKWFRFPVTRTLGNCKYFLFSTAILPDADTQEGSE